MSVIVALPPRPPASCISAAPATALFNWLYRPPPQGRLPAAHRGHRPAALDPGRHRRHHRRPEMARPRLGRRDRLPVRPRRPPRRGGPPAAGRGQGLSLLLHAGGAGGRCARSSKAKGLPLRYDGRWRDRDPTEAPPGVKPVIRLKAPQTGETVVQDLVQGEVRVGQHRARRHGPAARRRHADLHASRSWSTITTWASPTSSAATTT